MVATPAHAEDVVQAVGLPASGSCFNITDPTLNLAGVPYGGWTRSWGQWVNGGRGGFVCTRTLSSGTNGWFIVNHAPSDADLLQAVPVPAGGCLDVSLPSADWSGVPSGGWSLSWAQWANEGRGGLVCVRYLGANETTGSWYVV